MTDQEGENMPVGHVSLPGSYTRVVWDDVSQVQDSKGGPTATLCQLVLVCWSVRRLLLKDVLRDVLI